MSALFSQTHGQAEDSTGSFRVWLYLVQGEIPFGNSVTSKTNFSLLSDAKVLNTQVMFYKRYMHITI